MSEFLEPLTSLMVLIEAPFVRVGLGCPSRPARLEGEGGGAGRLRISVK